MTLHYPFPRIEHIDQVLPAIAGCPEFVVVNKPEQGLVVINYVFQGPETFPDVVDDHTAIRRECRGLLFDYKTGGVVGRRFHKFFNYGERADTQVVDVTRDHVVLEKLDGSMISPIYAGGGFRWTTKMGITGVALGAEVHVASRPEYDRLATWCLDTQATPIFEWCSRSQRIVIDYPEDQLTLLAIRDTISGRYWTRGDVVFTSRFFGVPVVDVVGGETADLAEFTEVLRARDDIEGVVLWFDDGHAVKIKTDAYISLHRAKSEIDSAHKVVEIILEDRVDDLLPVLPPADADRLREFSAQVAEDILAFSAKAASTLENAKLLGWSRKDFAVYSATEVSAPVRACVFALWDLAQESTGDGDVAAYAAVWARAFVLRATSSPSSYRDKASGIIVHKWRGHRE